MQRLCLVVWLMCLLPLMQLVADSANPNQAVLPAVSGDDWNPEENRISPRLQATLSDAEPMRMISVILYLEDQVDLESIRQQKGLDNFTRQARHEILVSSYKDFTTTSQTALKSLLDEAVLSGDVASYELYWIANACQIKSTSSFIENLAAFPGVGAIVEDLPPQSVYIPNQSANVTESNAGVTSALRVVGADIAWQMGYTGAGRLVASFDTGVDATHPALSTSWRGLTNSAAESWFDPVFGQSTPHWESSLGGVASHGTNTMGIILGKNSATGDTTGVAFGAQWIHAMVVDVPGANILEAFQWAVDPDGNPSTVDDVPDVINNSWGLLPSNLGCSDFFWSVIDNVEALGCVVIFAAGNEGPSASTLRNPANRASTPLSTFSVGGTDTLGTSIWNGSSRGPSNCNGVSIKPEIVAPGLNVRSTNAGSPTYGLNTGTSFSAPFVSGAVAILRQFNPNATVDQVKTALLNSATDRGAIGEDNTFGMGLLNIPGALALMPPTTDVNIFVAAVTPETDSSGASVNASVTLKNTGLGTLNVTAQLSNPDAGLTLVDDFASFGNLTQGASADNSSNPFMIQIAPGIPDGTVLKADMTVSAGGGSYTALRKFAIRVGPKQERSTYTHSPDSCQFTVSNYGTYGLSDASALDKNGVGFTFPAAGTNNLFQCGLLIGNGATLVADGVSNQILSVDADFTVAPGGNLVTAGTPLIGDVETISRFNDDGRASPLGLHVSQRTAEFAAAGDGNFVILQYIIQNTSAAPLNNLYVGQYCDWDFPWGTGARDVVNFSRAQNLGYQRDNTIAAFRGTAVLSDEGATTFRAINNSTFIYDGLTEAEKFTFMSAGLVDTANASVADHSYMIATGPFNLAPGARDTVAFAVVGAANLARLQQAAARANELYDASANFIPGDADGSGIVNISDVVYLIAYIFSGGPAPVPLAAGDADCSGIVNISDVVYLVAYIFSGGPPPCIP